MTVQVGMLGSNGIVLASDTKWNREPLKTLEDSRDDYGSSKIKISDSRRIAVTCARDMLAASFLASALMDGLKPEVWEDAEIPIRDIGCAAMATQRHLNVECLVALAAPNPCLYMFQYANQGTHVLSVRISTRIHIGDSTNPAKYWSLRYYRRLPVKRLMRLAAQVVTDAHEMNTATVDGLEIVYCEHDSGFHRMSDRENRKLEATARGYSNDIGEMLLKQVRLPSVSSNAP
ncbi:MAG TPA: hypothetical protein VI386_30290 [Candidatus Sulfotelmatobacter sp.]